MRSFFALLAALPAVLAAPPKVPSVDTPIKDQWIVKLDDGASSADLQSVIADLSNQFGTRPLHVYVRFAQIHTGCNQGRLTR